MAGDGKVLALVFHGWKLGAKSMGDIDRALKELWSDKVVILHPRLAYRTRFAYTRAATIVAKALEEIDTFIASRNDITEIVIIGHSVGATIARRVFLVAAGKPENFIAEEAIGNPERRIWADKVTRIVMMAAFSRGWKVSERTSWRNSILLNFYGLIGQIVPLLTPTIFDFRLGAPFMAQTRLNWMAFRRQTALDIPRPIVVQLIGTQDDMIAPIDQIDVSVDGSQRALVPAAMRSAREANDEKDLERDYFLIEMPFTDHENAITLFDKKNAAERKYLFEDALTKDRPGLHKISLDPILLADEVDPVDPTAKQVVFVMHGIRDDGFWTHRIAECIRRDQGTRLYRSWTPTYGYFAMLPFMLAWIRREKVEWFMDQYVSAFAQYPNADFHFVGHSNGTYLAARSFEDYPAFHLKRVLFAGSVVRRAFDWQALVSEKRVERFQNICAASDWVVAFFPKSVEWTGMFDLGAGGYDGFRNANSSPTLNELKYVAGGHGAGIMEEHWKAIATFILDGTPITPDVRPLFATHQKWCIKLIAVTRLAVPVGLFLFFIAAPLAFVFVHFDGTLRFEWSAWRVILLILYLSTLRFVITRV